MGEDYEPFMQASCADLAAPICGNCDDCQPVRTGEPVARCSWWSKYDAHEPHEWVSGWHGTQWCPGTAVKKARK